MRSFSAISLAVVLGATPAFAQSNDALAEALFRQAADLEKVGNIGEACKKFAESQKLDPQLGTLLNLARCHEKEGRTATAWSEYSQLLDRATRAGDTKRVEYARTRASALEPNLPKLRIVAKSTIRKLELDGAELGPSAWALPLPVDPGAHEFNVEWAEGGRASERAIALTGRTIDVELARTAAHAPVTAEPAAHETPTDTRTTPGIGTKVLGYAMVAIGGAGTITGGIFGALAMSRTADVRDGCDGPRCTPAGFEAQGDARTLANLSTGFVVGGLVLLAGGVGVLTLLTNTK